MQNLVSIGGPQQGVYGLPKCLGENHKLCDYVRRLLNYGAYLGWIQDILVQAQYWHDPLAELEYQENSLYLADINNQGPVKNSTYRDNLLAIDNLVLVKFNQDTIVDPRESEWFGWFSPSDHTTMIPLKVKIEKLYLIKYHLYYTIHVYIIKETEMYKQDWIGLKQLDEDGRLKFMAVEVTKLYT